MSRVTSLSRKVSCIRCRLCCSLIGLHVHWRMAHPETPFAPPAYPQLGAHLSRSVRSRSSLETRTVHE